MAASVGLSDFRLFEQHLLERLREVLYSVDFPLACKKLVSEIAVQFGADQALALKRSNTDIETVALANELRVPPGHSRQYAHVISPAWKRDSAMRTVLELESATKDFVQRQHLLISPVIDMARETTMLFVVLRSDDKGPFTPEHQRSLERLTAFLTPALNSLFERVHLSRELVDTQRLVHDTKAAQRARSAFLASMSHEIRTPLTSILGFAQLLEMEPLTSEQSEFLDHISKAGKHLLTLIDDLLEMSRINAGKITLIMQELDINQQLRECIELVRPMAEEERVSIEVEYYEGAAPKVLGDPQRTRQILLNLLSNAIKYNKRGGRVTVRVRLTDYVEIVVSDTGPGLLKSEVPYLFSRLMYGEDLNESSGGLGLSIANALTEAMNGRLTADSQPGKGATFTLRFGRLMEEIEPATVAGGSTSGSGESSAAERWTSN